MTRNVPGAVASMDGDNGGGATSGGVVLAWAMGVLSGMIACFQRRAGMVILPEN